MWTMCSGLKRLCVFAFAEANARFVFGYAVMLVVTQFVSKSHPAVWHFARILNTSGLVIGNFPTTPGKWLFRRFETTNGSTKGPHVAKVSVVKKRRNNRAAKWRFNAFLWLDAPPVFASVDPPCFGVGRQIEFGVVVISGGEFPPGNCVNNHVCCFHVFTSWHLPRIKDTSPVGLSQVKLDFF